MLTSQMLNSVMLSGTAYLLKGVYDYFRLFKIVHSE